MGVGCKCTQSGNSHVYHDVCVIVCSLEERVGVSGLQPVAWCMCSPKSDAGLQDLSASNQGIMVLCTLVESYLYTSNKVL